MGIPESNTRNRKCIILNYVEYDEDVTKGLIDQLMEFMKKKEKVCPKTSDWS